MATDHRLPLPSNVHKNWRRRLYGKVMKLQKERQEMPQWNRMFSKGSLCRTWSVVLRGIAKPLKSCERWWYPRLKLFRREKLFHMMEHVPHSSKPQRPHKSVCALVRGYFVFVLARGRKQMVIRRNKMKQALEGTLNVKKGSVIKMWASVQVIVR